MKKRLLSLLLCLVMVLSLAPFSVFADEANAAPGEVTLGGLTLDKKLIQQTDGSYNLELSAYATGTTVTETEMTPMDIVMVIDQSGSMGTTDMNPTYVATSSQNWTVAAATGATTYYYKVGNKYYPVQAQEGTLYEKVARDPYIYQMIGGGHDGASLGVNGTPTHFNVPTNYYCMGSDNKIHKVYVITAGVFAQYYAYPYYYLDDNDTIAGYSEWQNNIYWVAVFDPWDGHDYDKLRETGLGVSGGERKTYWKTLTDAHRVNFLGQTNMNQAAAKAARKSYSWISNGDSVSGLYLPKDGTNYNGLYYVNDSGNKVPIGNTVYTESQTAYSGVLYTVEGESRVGVLQKAATQFVQAVADNAKENNVDHRIAMVGFAGNKFPALSDGVTAYNTTKYDFTNTGLFVNGGFKNYQKLKTMSSTSTHYINMHYYTSGVVNNGIPSGVPVTYRGGTWYRLGTTTAFTGTFYEPNYDPLTATDYQNALVDASQKTGDGYNGTVTGDLTTAIANFAHYGGTYTSYGMTMANNIFENNTKTYTDNEGVEQQRARVIVVFTDGEPGGNGYSSSIAGEALVDGNRAKYALDANGYDATVYTIGLFPGNASTEVETFMRQLSSEYTVPVSNVYGGTNNGVSATGSGTLDGSQTYYITDTDGKTLAVTTQHNGLSTLGWWTKGEDGYTRQYPKTGSDDSRTVDGQSVITFYNASGNAVYEENLNTNTVYFTSSRTHNASTAIKYEYRWYDSNNKVRDPIKQSYGTYDTTRNTWQFFALGTPTHNNDGTYYYDVKNEAATLAAFNAAFEQIKTQHSKPITNVTLTTGSVLRDVIDTANFDLTNPSVTPQTAAGTYNASGAPTFAAPQTASGVNYSWSGSTLNVDNFNFQEQYIADGHPGQKLIVTITGLTPKTAGEVLYSNTDASGVYETSTSSDPVLAFPKPSISVGADTIVIDYNYPIQLTSTLGSGAAKTASINGTHGAFTNNTAAGNSGTYTLSGQTLTYQLYTGKLNPLTANAVPNATDAETHKSTASTNTYDINLGVYGGVDTALFYESAGWKQVKTLPATSVYYSDTLTAPKTELNGDGSNAAAATGAVRFESDAKGTQVYYTFCGTGIDVYSTTTNSGKYITATLTGVTDPNYKDSATYKNQSNGADRVNVPSIFFHDLPYGTYTLRLVASKGVDYKLDGIRVYDPAGVSVVNDQKTDDAEDANAIYAADDLQEQNATFTNMRDLLIDGANMGSGIGFFSDTDAASADDEGATKKKIEIEFRDENGKVIEEKTQTYEYFAHELTAYQIEGPKNEIYLDAGNAIAFTVSGIPEGENLKFMMGISAVRGTPTASNKITINGSFKQITTVDQYFDVTPGSNNTITVLNPSNSGLLVSLTNIKVSGGSRPYEVRASGAVAAKALAVEDDDAAAVEEPGVLYVSVNEETVAVASKLNAMRYAASVNGVLVDETEVVDPATPEATPEVTPAPSPVPTHDPTPNTPGIHSFVQQLLSSFVQSLFQSISRLFGN